MFEKFFRVHFNDGKIYSNRIDLSINGTITISERQKRTLDLKAREIFIVLGLLFLLLLPLSAAQELEGHRELFRQEEFNLSGKWMMIANAIYTFDLDLQQNKDQITGTMTCTNIATEPVDTIRGTISSNGIIQFTRARAGAWTQVYSAKVTSSKDALTIEGTYNHNNAGQYPWNASKAGGPIRSSLKIITNKPSDGVGYSKVQLEVNRELFGQEEFNLSGKWMMIANAIYTFDLDLQQNKDQITGTMTCTNITTEPVDTIRGTISSTGIIQFTRARAGAWTQIYSAKVTSSRDSLTMEGTYSHNNAGQYPWNASKAGGPIGRSLEIIPNKPSDGIGYSKVHLGSGLNTELNRYTLGQMRNMSLSTWEGTRRMLVERVLRLPRMAELEVSEDSYFIDTRKTDLKASFSWKPNGNNVTVAFWQVSTLPFPDDARNWQNPPGLVSSGRLSIDQSMKFSIDFSQFAPRNSEVASYWMNTHPYLVFQKEMLLSLKEAASENLNQANALSIQRAKDVIAMTDEAIQTLNSNPNLIKQSYVAIEASNLGEKISRPDSALSSIYAAPAFLNSSMTLLRAQASPGNAQVQPDGNSVFKGPTLFQQDMIKRATTSLLPQRQRAYYVRVVPLDAQGNCAGLPSDTKRVILGLPNIRSSNNQEDQIKLRSSPIVRRPQGMEMAASLTYWEKGTSIDWSNTESEAQNCWFAWRSDLPDLTEAEWQVSLVPFSSQGDLESPPGLITRGNLSVDASDLSDRFLLKDFIPAHEFSIDFSKFAPPYDPGNPDMQIKYFVRVVAKAPTRDPGFYVGYTSPTRNITYGKPNQPNIKLFFPTQVVQKILIPDVSIEQWGPYKAASSDCMYRFLCTKGCFSNKPGGGWPVYLPPQPAEDKNFIQQAFDLISEIFGSVSKFLEEMVNWTSQLYSKAQELAISFVAKAACGGDSECIGAITPVLDSALNAAIASMGIPPSIPNFDQLTNMGKDYMIQTLAAQAGADPNLVKLNLDVIEGCVDTFATESGKANPEDPMGLKPDPDYQYRPANMTIKLTNSHSTRTLPGTMKVWDEKGLFEPKSVAIPPLEPGQALTIPVFLKEGNLSQMDCITWNDNMGANTWYTCDIGYIDPRSGSYNTSGPQLDAMTLAEWYDQLDKPDTFYVSVDCAPTDSLSIFAQKNIERMLELKYGKNCGGNYVGCTGYYIYYDRQGDGYKEMSITPSSYYDDLSSDKGYSFAKINAVAI